MFKNYGNAILVKSHVFDSKEVKKLTLKYLSDNIYIYPSLTEEIILEEYMEVPSEEKMAHIVFENNHIEILSGKRDFDIFSISKNFNNYVYLYLPKSFSEELIIENNSGIISAQNEDFEHGVENFDMKILSLNAKTTSGAIKLANIDAKHTIKIETNSGSIKAKNIISEDIFMKTISGGIEVDSVSASQAIVDSTHGSVNIASEVIANNAHIKTVSGSIKIPTVKGVLSAFTTSGTINIESLYGGGEFSTVSGSIKIEEIESINDNITIKSTSGSVKIGTNKSLAFYVHIKTISGNVSTFFNNQNIKQYSDIYGASPKFNISISTVSGSIKWL